MALAVDVRDGKEAGAMEVDVRIEVLAVKVVEPWSPLAGEMVIAKMLTDDAPILGLRQCVVVGVTGT